MSTAGLSSTTRKFTLSFYFWLPAGRDEFELSRGDDQPFKDTANYRDKIESAVAKNLMIKINELSEKSSESFWLNNSSDLKVQDSNLGLRSLAFEFRYEPKRDENEDKSKTYNLPNQMARALILSNGLYLWQFDVEYRSDLSEQDISKSAGEFLRDHFVKEHISKLFNFEWAEKIKLVASPKDKKAYSGALTYYQIDLLFNGIFDKDAHPDNFIEPHSGSKSSDRIEGNDEHNYNVQGIIQSLSRFAINNHHYPLFVDFDKIPPTGAFENTFMEPISTDTDLFGTAPNTEADRFLSRISHAGMEQFLKAAISFGVIHYKAGLDHCRAQLTNASLLIRIHKTAGELLRPSLSPDLSSADLQAYTSIVAGKLPAFCFLYSLIEGIAQATRPFEARKDSRLGELEWDEWVHSQFTLHNALLYYPYPQAVVAFDLGESVGKDTLPCALC